MENISNDIYTPSSIFCTIANYYALPDELKRPIILKGIFIKGNGGYDTLKDTVNDAYFRLSIPQNIRVSLQDNVVYSFKGVLSARMFKGNMLFSFYVTEQPDNIQSIDSRLSEINELIRIKEAKSSVRIPSDIIRKNLMEGRKTRILCVFPNETKTRDEFMSQFSSYSDAYSIEEKCANFAVSDVFQSKIKEYDRMGYEIIILLRGGVENIDMFNNLDIAKTLLEMETPLLLGVGHLSSNIILRNFVPEWKANPTETGILLKDLAKDRIEKFRLSKERDELRKNIQGKDTIIKEKDNVITGKDNIIKEKDRALLEKDKMLGQRIVQIKQQESELRMLRSRIAKDPYKEKFYVIRLICIALIIIIFLILFS